MQARRDKQTKDALPPDFLDCDTCLVRATERERASMRCGWLPKAKHLSGDVAFPECAVCPGYSIRLPEVIEAARALAWSKRGGLVPLYGSRRLPPSAVQAIDILDHAATQVERRLIREAGEREP